MTNRDFFTKVIALGDAELVEYATAAIAKIDADNEKRRAKNAEKRAEIQPTLDHIYEVILTDDPVTASDVAAALDGVSVQKATYFLKTLVAQEKAAQTEISIKGKGKVKGYAKI
jgi:hypothetical protein